MASDIAIEALANSLKRPDKALLMRLPAVPSYEVGGLRRVPFTVVLRLRKAKLIDEQWTWASGATPDVGVTPLGVQVRDFLRDGTLSDTSLERGA